MNIVFLDIDGVLNHDLFYKEKSQNERYKEVGRPLCDLDPTRVRLLNTLLKNTKSKVVISSTWRKSRNKKDLQALLNEIGFTIRERESPRL